MPFTTAGTGFTNIDKILQANSGAGKAVQAAAQDPFAQETSRLGAATAPAEQALGLGSGGTSFGAKYGMATESPSLFGPKTYSAADIGKMASNGTLGQAVNQTWTGPKSVNYNPNSASQDELNALANTATAGRQLYLNAGNAAGNYSPQLSAIDAAIYGSGQNKDASANVGNQLSAFNTKAANTVSSLNKSLSSAAANTAQSATNARNAAEQYRQQLVAAAQQKADAANQQSMSDFSQGIVRDPSTGQVVTIKDPSKQIGGSLIGKGAWVGNAPNSATAGNFIDPSQSTQLQAINAAIGGNSPLYAGAYQPGNYSQVRVAATGKPSTGVTGTPQPINLNAQQAQQRGDIAGNALLNILLPGIGYGISSLNSAQQQKLQQSGERKPMRYDAGGSP